jgi:hypothetical protein
MPAPNKNAPQPASWTRSARRDCRSAWPI